MVRRTNIDWPSSGVNTQRYVLNLCLVILKHQSPKMQYFISTWLIYGTLTNATILAEIESRANDSKGVITHSPLLKNTEPHHQINFRITPRIYLFVKCLDTLQSMYSGHPPTRHTIIDRPNICNSFNEDNNMHSVHMHFIISQFQDDIQSLHIDFLLSVYKRAEWFYLAQR